MPTALDISKMTLAQKAELLALFEAKEKAIRYNYIDTLFPDTGPLSRSKYSEHMEFFKGGKEHKFRLCIAANQSGKSLMCCYELACHLTGVYPPWWEGKWLAKAVDWWICGETAGLLRQSIQDRLLGPVGDYGTGMIRRECLDFESLTDTKKVASNVSSFRVKHISGKFCKVELKAYEMGRTAFQAATVNILLDEEPPEDIYNECMTRTVALGKNAMVMLNFTPMRGETNLVLGFMEGHPYVTGEISDSKHFTHLTWEDAPHLTEEAKAELIKLFPPYMLAARTQGLPMMGVGLVYPIAEDKVFIDPMGFSIPDHWKRYYAVDFGWVDPTVITWHAVDPDTDIDYQYFEHYLTEAPPATHAAIINAQNRLAGFKIPGCCDPSGGGRSGTDGKQTRRMYEEEFGIVMMNADNAIETGIAKTFQAMLDGKLKIFSTCVNTRKEFRSYVRAKNGFSGADHAMDTVRYGTMTGRGIAKSKKESTALEVEQVLDFPADFTSSFALLYNFASL